MSSTSQATSIASHTILTLRDGITLRRLHEGDIPDSVQHLNDPEVRTFLRNRIPFPYTESDAKWWINHCSDQANWIPSGSFKLDTQSSEPQLLPGHYVIAKDDRLIGAIGLERKDDIYFRTAELGYWLARPYWGKGIMGSVVQAFVPWAFETFGIIYRIEAQVTAGNDASGAVLKKAGMKFEGRHEGAVWKNGRIQAEDFWGIIRTEEDDKQ